MSRPTTVSIWAVVGLILSGFFIPAFFALLGAGTGLSSYCGLALIIGIVDIVLSFSAAVFTDSALSFVVAYSIPFVLVAASNTFALLYSLLDIRVILLWWGLAVVIFSIGLAGGLLGRFVRRTRAKSRRFRAD